MSSYLTETDQEPCPASPASQGDIAPCEPSPCDNGLVVEAIITATIVDSPGAPPGSLSDAASGSQAGESGAKSNSPALQHWKAFSITFCAKRISNGWQSSVPPSSWPLR